MWCKNSQKERRGDGGANGARECCTTGKESCQAPWVVPVSLLFKNAFFPAEFITDDVLKSL